MRSHASMSDTTAAGVWGVGREGLSATRFLTHQGHRVVAVDENGSPRPAGLADEVEFFSGAGALERLLDCSLVVVSPGIPRVHPFREALRTRGTEVTTATNLWLRANAQRTVGVTGTKGKSTTASLIHSLLNAGGVHSELGGNIGVPLTDVSGSGDVAVAELSSYQCAYLERSPRVAVVTNLYQDHLQWHGSVDQYWLDKSRIFTEGADVLVCTGATLAVIRKMGVAVPPTVRTPDEPYLNGIEAMTLPAAVSAPHNVENLKLALLAAREVSHFAPELPEAIDALAQFDALPHRLQVVTRRGGRTWVDDSLSTTGDSVIAAIESFPGRELVLIIGGLERGIDYSTLSAALEFRTPAIHLVCLPDNGPTIAAPHASVRPDLVHSAANMQDAVAIARRVSAADSVIILSPGAPSQNAYRSYEEKSDDFVRSVLSLQEVE